MIQWWIVLSDIQFGIQFWYMDFSLYHPDSVHMEKISPIRRIKMVILEGGITLWYLRYANYWTHRNGRKIQHFNYYKLWYLFLYVGIFHSKSIIMLVLCLNVEFVFIHFYWMFLKKRYCQFWRYFFCAVLVVIKPEFPFKLCITDCITSGFDKQFIFKTIYPVV